jgi:hypothetical protein
MLPKHGGPSAVTLIRPYMVTQNPAKGKGFRAEPLHRTPTNYVSIIVVDLHLLVIALVGSRIARDAQRNVADLRTTIDQLSDVMSS